MQFSEVLAKRRSVRHFSGSRPVDDAEITQILEAGALAPSAGNIQPWRFTVVKTDAAREQLNDALGQRWVASAPVLIVVSVDPRPSTARYGERGTMLYCIQDSAAAVENMLLKAVDLGLASCWIGAFDEAKVARAIGLTPPITPVAILPVGHSAQASGPQPRRPLSEITRWI